MESIKSNKSNISFFNFRSKYSGGKELQVILAKCSCRDISLEEIHGMIDEIYEEYGGLK